MALSEQEGGIREHNDVRLDPRDIMVDIMRECLPFVVSSCESSSPVWKFGIIQSVIQERKTPTFYTGEDDSNLSYKSG